MIKDSILKYLYKHEVDKHIELNIKLAVIITMMLLMYILPETAPPILDIFIASTLTMITGFIIFIDLVVYDIAYWECKRVWNNDKHE